MSSTRKTIEKTARLLDRKGPVRALAYLEKSVRGRDLAHTPVDLVVENVKLLILADRRAESFFLARRALDRLEGDSREPVLRATTPLLAIDPPPELEWVTTLYEGWIDTGHPAIASQIVARMRRYPPALRRGFRDWAKQVSPPLRALARGHWYLHENRPDRAVYFLTEASRCGPDLAAHASDVIATLEIGDDPECLAHAVEIHLRAGRSQPAGSALLGHVRHDALAAVGRIRELIVSGLVSADDAETLVRRALERRPESFALREFLVDRCLETGRARAACALLREGLERAPSADLERLLGRAEAIDAKGVAGLDAALLRGSLLARLDRPGELLAVARGSAAEAPARTIDMLDAWRDRAATPHPEIEGLRASTLAALGRHGEAVRGLEGILDSEESMREGLPALAGLVEEHSDATPAYALLHARALLGAGEDDRALDRLEELIAPPHEAFEPVAEILTGSAVADAPSGILLAVRCDLHLGRHAEALGALERLADDGAELVRIALLAALRWREAWAGRTDWARRVATLLVRSSLHEEGADLVDRAARDEESARALLDLFDEPALAETRDRRWLACRFDLETRAGRLEDARRTARRIADAGAPLERLRRLTRLGDRPDAPENLPLEIFETAVRLARPVPEILDLAETILDRGEADELATAEDLLEGLARSIDLGDEGRLVRGRITVALGRIAEALEILVPALESTPRRAEPILLEPLAREAGLSDVRAAIANARRSRGDPAGSVSILSEAPERTEPLFAALERLVADRPPPLPAVWMLADWLEDAGRMPDLVRHLDQATDLDGIDPAAIAATLERLETSFAPTIPALRLRVRLARRRGDSAEAARLLARMVRTDPSRAEEALGIADEVLAERAGHLETAVVALEVSAAAGQPDRLGAEAASLLDRAPADLLRRTAAVLDEALGDACFGESRVCLGTRYELALRLTDRTVAAALLPRLLRASSDDPDLRARSCRGFRKAFGPEASALSAEAGALIERNRVEAAVPRILDLATLAGDEDGPFRTARGLVERALARAPDSAGAHLLASDLAARADEPTRALEHALGALTNGPEPREVESRLEALHARFPEDPRFAVALAREILLPRDALELAADWLERALDRAPEGDAAILDLSRRLLDGRPTSVPLLLTHTRAAVARAPESRPVADEAVRTLVRLTSEAASAADAALERLDRVLERYPEHDEGLDLRQSLLRALGRPEEAVAILEERIVPRAPDAGEELRARSELARALEEAGDPDRALSEWRRCSALAPEDHDAWIAMRGNHGLRLERLAASLPEDGPARAFVALWTGRAEEALDATAPTNDGPPSIAVLAVRGGALLALGRAQEAVRDLGEHLDRVDPAEPLGPDSREFLFVLGRAALEIGDLPHALRCLERLAREAPGYRGARRILEHVVTGDSWLGRPLEETSTLEGMDAP